MRDLRLIPKKTMYFLWKFLTQDVNGSSGVHDFSRILKKISHKVNGGEEITESMCQYFPRDFLKGSLAFWRAETEVRRRILENRSDYL